jgi:hypothetical protein
MEIWNSYTNMSLNEGGRKERSGRRRRRRRKGRRKDIRSEKEGRKEEELTQFTMGSPFVLFLQALGNEVQSGSEEPSAKRTFNWKI